MSFRSENGELRGWLLRANTPRGTVITVHGVRSNRATMLGRMDLSSRLGLNAFAFDLQAHGESDGSRITFGYRERLDVQAAVRLVRNRLETPIFVIGVSLGGAAAVLADPPLEVSGLILEAVFPDIETAVGNRLDIRFPYASLATPLLTWQLGPRLGISAGDLSPMRSAGFVSTPVLILNGTADRHTTVRDADRLLGAFQGEKNVAWFEGASHVDLYSYDNVLYEATVSEFIRKHLPK